LDRILDGDAFIRAVFSGRQHGRTLDWVRVVVRPVEIRGARRWQFSYFDAAKDITKNYAAPEARAQLEALFDLPFRNIHVQTSGGILELRITKKGQVLVHEAAATAANAAQPADLAHDRAKARILPASEPAPFLQAIGIMTQDGKIRAHMQAKYRQINEFLRLLEQTHVFDEPAAAPIRVVDFGCGNAYLTFALYHYLNQTLGHTAYVTGVDLKADLLDKHRAHAAALGWERLTFAVGQIAAYQPPAPPDMVVALHACDTATDDALAQGLRAGSKLIVVAPCCQHDVQAQMAHAPTPPPFGLVARHGILHERLGDLLTDAFRAAILRLLGYRAEVIQFVSTEHTAKNLMIRAVKAHAPADAELAREYRALKALWQVTPYLEGLLGEGYAELLR
jgi:SAM-dependent methyltransferase